MQKRAALKGGKCLSTEYLGCNVMLKWKCNCGYEWDAVPSGIKRGYWCHWCSGKMKLTIEDMQKIAADNGGKCLSTEYVNTQTKLEWECECGYKWFATPGHVKHSKSWCGKCAENAKLTLEDMQIIAKSRGGKCLSTEYVNYKSDLEWECKKEHKWFAPARGVKSNGNWCLICSGHAPLTIQEMQDLAKARGGECLSKVYVNSYTPLEWKCGKGHKSWFAVADSVKNSGSWCPDCPLKNESECRAIFEKLFGRPFVKVRPDWLGGLELDGYNEDLWLAFEYHGKQHDTVVPHFHPNGDKDLEKQKERDKRKRKLCEENKITLIEVWHHEKDKELFIRGECAKLGIRIPLLDYDISPENQELLAEFSAMYREEARVEEERIKTEELIKELYANA